ncbi:hypothetical protein ABF162_25055 (plasmid) [Vibrio coralliilyticus]|uniref:hypothetical protein n=1 Tax=Vibrio coralliilyticus TaxID=190893 RepID=UPI000512782F|nr:hypothetical protein [Vibrio coralliilyticus]AIS58294.1 hypothetical protein JV59_24995 [Vibrio coralliilyticus]
MKAWLPMLAVILITLAFIAFFYLIPVRFGADELCREIKRYEAYQRHPYRNPCSPGWPGPALTLDKRHG